MVYLRLQDNYEKPEKTQDSQESFEALYSAELRDFNSAGVVAANQGIPLSKMDKNIYHVYNERIQVAKEQRELCRTTIENLVSRL